MSTTNSQGVRPMFQTICFAAAGLVLALLLATNIALMMKR